MRLSHRFAVIGTAGALLPLLAFGAVSVGALREGTRQSVHLGLVNLTDRTASQMDTWLDRTTAQVAALAAEFEGNRLERWQQERAVRHWVLRFAEIRELVVYDEHGVPLVSSRLAVAGAPRPPLDRDGPHRTRLSGVTLDEDLLPAMHVGAAFQQADGRRQLLVATLNLEQIWLVVDGLRVGDRGYALLLDERGRLFAHGNPDRKRDIARGDRLDAHPLARSDERRGVRTGEPVQYAGGDGVMRLAVASRVPAAGWTLVIEQPVSEAFAAASRLQGWLFASIGAALFVMVGLGAWLGRSLVVPIATLVRGTEALAGGDLGARIALRGGDEFQRLAVAFNRMAERLSELRDATRRQERQAMFGQIASGLVHDLSHPVQNLANQSRLLARRPDDQAFRVTFERMVAREAELMRRVLDDLRQVGSPTPLVRVRLDVRRSVRTAAEAMQVTCQAAGLSLNLAQEADPVHVLADAAALDRVWRNLLQNAIDATPAGGRVDVTAGGDDLTGWVRVGDTGHGIDAARVPRVFDEFVTTKHRGLGLGLAICKRLVEQMDGQISVASVVGHGAQFEVRLPRASRVAGTPE